MSNVKKTHWLRNTLIVLIICGLVGTILAGVQFTKRKSAVTASATLEMSFENAASGLAPNGNRYDVRDMASDELLLQALEASSLSGTYTPDQIRSSLRITGAYPEDLVEQYTSTVSVLKSSGNQELTISDYHPTAYGVVLTNDFDTGISQAQLTTLLENILAAYKTYFTASGAYALTTESTVYNIEDYDYPQQLEVIQAQLKNINEYAGIMYGKYPEFRLNGKGFNDITVRIDNLISGELSQAEAQMTMNALSKNNVRLLTQYQYEIKSLTTQLKYKNETLEKVEKLISSYQKNVTFYLSTADALNKISGNSSETYDALVDQRKAISDEINAINTKINEYQLKIADMTSGEETTATTASDVENTAETVSEMTEEEKEAAVAQAAKKKETQIAALEASIASLVAKQKEIVADFSAMIQAENAKQINDLTVSVSSVRYSAPGLISGAFAKQVIKTAGPFCALGLMVCLMLIFISRRKESKSAQ